MAISPLFPVSPQWLQLALAVLIFTAVLMAWAKWVEGSDLGNYGLRFSKAFGLEFLVGVAIGALVIGLIFVSLMAWSSSDAPQVNLSAVTAGFWLFLFRMLLVGYWEELLFRGFLFTVFKDAIPSKISNSMRLMIALIVSSLLFGLAHSLTSNFSWPAFALLSINGAVFAIPMIMTGRLGMSIGMHAAWNFSQAMIFGFPMSGNDNYNSLLKLSHGAPDFWSGGQYGPEAGLSGLVAMILMALFAFFYCRLSVSGRQI